MGAVMSQSTSQAGPTGHQRAFRSVFIQIYRMRHAITELQRAVDDVEEAIQQVGKANPGSHDRS